MLIYDTLNLLQIIVKKPSKAILKPIQKLVKEILFHLALFTVINLGHL